MIVTNVIVPSPPPENEALHLETSQPVADSSPAKSQIAMSTVHKATFHLPSGRLT